MSSRDSSSSIASSTNSCNSWSSSIPSNTNSWGSSDMALDYGSTSSIANML